MTFVHISENVKTENARLECSSFEIIIWIDTAGLQIYMQFSCYAQIICLDMLLFNFSICKSLYDDEVKSPMRFQTKTEMCPSCNMD